MYWVVAYDVRQTPRRNRVARKLERAGLRVQKSVFLVEMGEKQVGKLVEELDRLIDPETDQVAAWPLRQESDPRDVQAGFPQGPQYRDVVIW